MPHDRNAPPGVLSTLEACPNPCSPDRIRLIVISHMLSIASFFIPLAIAAGVPGLLVALAVRPWRRLTEEP